MLYFKDFKETKLKNEKGLGGSLVLLTSRSDESVSYVVKGDEREQSINEFVAQHLLGALGFYSIPVELICSNYTYYGVVRFVEGLERLHWDDYLNLTDAQKKAFIELFVLNGMLFNPDEGELYFTKTGEVCSLDYGEAIIGTFIPKIALSGMPQFLPSSRRDIEQSEHDNIKTRIEYCAEKLQKQFSVQRSEAIEYGLCAVKRFAELDEDKMSDCYTAIDKAFYKGAADIYKDRVTDIIICARNYLSRR